MSLRHQTDELVDPLADVTQETEKLRLVAKEILEMNEGQTLPHDLIQRALTPLASLYAVDYQKGDRVSPFSKESPVSATVALILVSAVLKTVNVEPFELGMWQAWSGA